VRNELKDKGIDDKIAYKEGQARQGAARLAKMVQQDGVLPARLGRARQCHDEELV